MDLVIFQEEAKRTVESPEVFEEALSHYCIGLSGKSGEVLEKMYNRTVMDVYSSDKDIALEAGDVLWYAVRIADLIEVKISDLVQFSMDDILVKNNKVLLDNTDLINYSILLTIECSKMNDYIKKVLYQQHPYEQYVIVNLLSNIIWYLKKIVNQLGYSLEDIAGFNVIKRKKSYPF